MNWDDRTEAINLIRKPRARHGLEGLRQHFIDRTLDEHFIYLGRLGTERSGAPDYILAWEGFALAVGNQYSVYGIQGRSLNFSEDTDN